MKKILKKMCLMLFIICSLFSIFTVSSLDRIEAVSSEIIQESINIESTVREDNIIKFKPKDTSNKYVSATYEVVYIVDDVKYSDLVVDANISMTNDNVYYFEVSDSIIGVKIWKLKYFVSTDNFKNKMTTGNNYVGDVDSVYKKNYVEVTTDKLDKISLGGESFLDFTDYDYIFVFYFNLDTNIEKIDSLSLEYSIKTEKKAWWGLDKETSTKSYSVNLDHTQQVIDYDTVYTLYFEYVMNNEATWQELSEYKKELANTYKRDVLGSNINGNGYDWYVQPLLDVSLEDKNYVAGSGYYKEDLQEVAIVKMSYYTQGEYFEDVPVLDEDTGIIVYSSKVTIFDKIVEFIAALINALKNNNLRWYHLVLIAIAIIIVIRIIGWLLGLIGLDKKSRIRRANDKLDELDLKDRKNERKTKEAELRKENKLRKNSYNAKPTNYYNNNRNR